MTKQILFILTLLFAHDCFCQADEVSSFLKINFKAEATIKVDFRNFSDSILLSSRFYNFFPNDEIEGVQKKLYGDGTEYVTLKIQIPQKVDLNFSDYVSDSLQEVTEDKDPGKDLYVTCFLVPFDTLTLEVDYAQVMQQNQPIIFYGKYADISKYYQDKAIYFPGIDFLDKKATLSNTLMNLNSFKHATDSISNIELSFLSDYCSKNKLPEWFIDYESSDLNYFGYGGKLTEPFLIKYFYDSTLQVPEDYFSFTKELQLDNEKAILSVYYYESLRDYFSAIWEPAKTKEWTPGKSMPNASEDFVEYSQSQFSPYISDIILARHLDMYIETNYVTEDQYKITIATIQDTSLIDYLKFRYASREILKKGDDAPDFYLKNENDEYLSLKNFQDTIVYISFWMTGCKPCIKEFPEENRLVDIFKDEKVKIISICMDSREENWRYMIREHQLKSVNLFANANWEKIITESYHISGFPHYVIIDKENKIIENNCVRPSQGADQLIRNALEN